MLMPQRETFVLLPPATPLLLYLWFAPFAAVFAVGVYRRLRAVGFPALRPGPVGEVARQFVRLAKYGFLQRRVGERSGGWPHLGIFFGFLTLLAGTVLVALDGGLLKPLGYRLLTGSFYLAVEAALDLMGAVFLVAVLVAFIRRLIRMRRASHDQRRIQVRFSLLLAGFLYLAATGFGLEALRLAIHPVAWSEWSFVGAHLAAALRSYHLVDGVALYPMLWWSHATVAFALIAALPFSVFLHSVSAPLNVMVQTGVPNPELSTPFDLRQLQETGNFDVKVGASVLGDFAPEHRLALLACTNCGRCDDACPAVAMGTALSPRKLVQVLQAKAMAQDTATDLFSAGVVSEPEVWACTTCAVCVRACPVLIRPVDYIVPLRRALLTRQRLNERLAALLENLGQSFNAYGLPGARRGDLPRELGLKMIRDEIAATR